MRFKRYKTNIEMDNFYLNNLDVLQSYCDYFKIKAADLLIKAEHQKIITSFHNRGIKPSHSINAMDTLAKTISSLEKNYSKNIGVYAIDTRTNQIISHRAKETFPLQSTFKLFVAAMLLKNSEKNPEILNTAIPSPHYEEAQLLKLQQILFFRGLGFRLDDIQSILSSSDFDQKKHYLITERPCNKGLIRQNY